MRFLASKAPPKFIFMNAVQKVFKVRRNYNRWVANETLEDYALRFTAKSARRWSSIQVSGTALGAITFLALEAIGGTITLNHGFTNAVLAIGIVSLILCLVAFPICYHAATQGVDIDLLTRGAGFGYLGSTITSLIYASFTFIFFALEAAILSFALELTLGLPLVYGYIISSLIVIPLVTHGITFISRFQSWTQPIWVFLQIAALTSIAIQAEDALQLWSNYVPDNGVQGFNLMAFGAASIVLFSLIAQIGEQVDFLRFLPERKKNDWRWWVAVVSAGPGWVFIGAFKLLVGSLLAVIALNHGTSFENAADPNHMYMTAFLMITPHQQVAVWCTCIFVVLSQLKINVTNAYAGSIAWSNFFSRLTHSHPGRVVWMVFNVSIALILMEFGIYRVLEQILGAYAIVAVAWLGSITADLIINKPLKLRPQSFEFKRAHLYDINPVGLMSMLGACSLGFSAYAGFLGDAAKALASFIALGSTFVICPIVAVWTKGKYYIARQSQTLPSKHACSVCEHTFEREDLAHCPVYDGVICSLCCSLDSRCEDKCKTDSRFADQLRNLLEKYFPNFLQPYFHSRLGHFLSVFIFTNIIVAALMALIYMQISTDSTVDDAVIARALTQVYVVLFIVSGIGSWMFALVHDSRRVAQEETKHQTQLLMAEIAAHSETDFALQQAKESAEAANLAKSRYLTGISHELRTPLNAIMGYAQLLENDPSMPQKRRPALAIMRRSSEYLTDLIEGLLDISRIEAGKLQLSRNKILFDVLVDQIADMFAMQAKAKHLKFVYERDSNIPKYVISDEKRLRQILINLLSNAVKYTQEGCITFSVGYRNQVARFSVKDTGVGISAENHDKIFKPFERILQPDEHQVSGTGLGLTITRLLIDIMGGDLALKSGLNNGSEFLVTLMLTTPNSLETEQSGNLAATQINGLGVTIGVVDDEPSHRQLMRDILVPQDFDVITWSNGKACLEDLQKAQNRVDIFILDVSMPHMSGWELATKIRSQFPYTKIIIVSANAAEPKKNEQLFQLIDGYIVKPVQFKPLFELLQQLISSHNCTTTIVRDSLVETKLIAKSSAAGNTTINYCEAIHPVDDSSMTISQIISNAKIGNLNKVLELIEASNLSTPLSNELHLLAKDFKFDAIIQLLSKR